MQSALAKWLRVLRFARADVFVTERRARLDVSQAFLDLAYESRLRRLVHCAASTSISGTVDARRAGT